MTKTVFSGKHSKPSTSDHHHQPIKDVERGPPAVDEQAIVKGLYNSAYSGERAEQEQFKKFFELPRDVRISLKLNQLVALNIAATRSNWDFVARMLRRMTEDELNVVLTTNHRHADLQKVRDDMIKYLKDKQVTDYTETMKRLDGSPESLLLAAASSSQLNVYHLLANFIHIENPACSGNFLYHIVNAGFYDVAFILCDRYPTLSVASIYMKMVDGHPKIVPRNDTWGKHDTNMEEVPAAKDKTEADHETDSAIPVSFSRSTILQVLANRPSAFRSSSRHGVHIIRGFVTWLLHLFSIKNQTPRSIVSPINVILGVMFHFIVPLWIVLENIVPVLKTYREEEQTNQYAEQLLEIIKNEIKKGNDKEIFHDELSYVIKIAARKGIYEIVTMCLNMFPSLIWEREKKRHILHDAIEFRHEKIFNLIRDKLLEDVLQVNTWFIFQECENIMLLAAKPPIQQTLEYIAGSALQLQRELYWFEEVENVAFALNYQKASNDKDKALSKFVENRKSLVEKAEEWMKSTATSCTVVAALVVTVVYQAAFQIPGGTDENNKGTAKLLAGHQNHPAFTVFAISDIASLLFSSISLLLFLGILTSRFSAVDFRYVLPQRLIAGHASLFIALTAMMVSYTATVVIVLGSKMKWLQILTICGVALPVALFAALQLGLFVALVRSTYFGRRIFKHKMKGLSFWGSLLAMYCRAIWPIKPCKE